MWAIWPALRVAASHQRPEALEQAFRRYGERIAVSGRAVMMNREAIAVEPAYLRSPPGM